MGCDSSSDSEGYITDESKKDSLRQQEKKRKRPLPQIKQSTQAAGLERKKQKPALDSKGAWLCASVSVPLEQSTKCCQNVSDAMIWSATELLANDEPHDCLIFASLLCSHTSCEDKRGDSEIDDREDSSSVFLMFTNYIEVALWCT